jgi:glycerate kinase
VAVKKRRPPVQFRAVPMIDGREVTVEELRADPRWQEKSARVLGRLARAALDVEERRLADCSAAAEAAQTSENGGIAS